jgi:hypothetical protein
MAKPTTELGQRCPPPPYTKWDQRGKGVLLVHLKKNHFIDGKSLHPSLETNDRHVAMRHMRWLVPMLLLQGRLRADSGAAKEYGAEGIRRSRLNAALREIRRLGRVADAEYGSEALATAKRWGRPLGFIHCLTGRQPELGAGAYRNRRSRARKQARLRGERETPERTSWHFRRQGKKYFYSNHGVMHARVQFERRDYKWPLGTRDQTAAARTMGPVRLAREGVWKAADKWGDYVLGTDASIGAGAALQTACGRFAEALHAAGAPPELVALAVKPPAKVSAASLLPIAVVGKATKQPKIKECVEWLNDLPADRECGWPTCAHTRGPTLGCRGGTSRRATIAAFARPRRSS